MYVFVYIIKNYRGFVGSVSDYIAVLCQPRDQYTLIEQSIDMHLNEMMPVCVCVS